MTIDIPKNYTYTDKNNNKAYEKGGILYVDGDISFENLMYHLVHFSKNKKKCYYCGKKLHAKIRSVDHKIPKYWGGISIPDNMAFSCRKCNEEKAILTAEQYETFRNISEDKKRKEYRNECYEKNESLVSEKGFCIPDDWFSYDIRSKIYVDIDFAETYDEDKYKKIKAHYKKYHKLPKPIIVSGNNILLSGYLILMFAKNKKIKKVPVLQLENIIVE